MISLSLSLSLSLHFNGHFSGEYGLAGIRMSPFWILLELQTTEVVVTVGATRRAKLQSNRHHQQTNTQLFTGRVPFLSSNQQCDSKMMHSENFATCQVTFLAFVKGTKHLSVLGPISRRNCPVIICTLNCSSILWRTVQQTVRYKIQITQSPRRQ